MRDVKKVIIDEQRRVNFNESSAYLLYKTILKTSMDGFWIVDIKGNILEVSDAYCKLVGYSRKELLSMNVADVEANKSQSEVRKNIQEIINAQLSRYETRHLCKDGTWIDIEVSTNSMVSDSNRIFAFLRDITELKQKRELLQKERDKAQKYLDIAGVILIHLDAEGTVTLINQKGCEIFGYEEKEFIGRNWFDNFLPKRIRKEVKSVFEKLMEGKIEPVEYFENPVITKTNQERLIAWHNTILKNDKGEIVGTLSSGEDITERRKAQEELLQARQDWENIFQAIGHPSLILNPEHTIISANRAAVKKAGLNLEQIIGQKCYVILHRTKCHPENCPMEKMLKTGCLETAEMEVEAFGGYYFVSCTPIRNKEGRLEKVIHIATDITEHKEIEEKLKKNQEQLKSLTSELSFAEERERRRIAAGLHDDIAQKLAIVKFGLDSLQGSVSKDDILSSLKRQDQLIEQAIEDVRSLTFELSNPLLYEIGIEAAVEAWLTEHIQEKCKINCKFNSKGPQIDIDDDIRIVLFQGVRELLTNVVKYANAKSIEVCIKRNKRQIKISVKDDGIGFDSKELDLPGSGKGGFGLFNIRERLEYLGGNIEIHSIPKHGTCVTMSVPIESIKKAPLKEL